MGVCPVASDVRLAWALTKVYEKKNPAKALLFAKYGFTRIVSTTPFFGDKDFVKVVTASNGA